MQIGNPLDISSEDKSPLAFANAQNEKKHSAQGGPRCRPKRHPACLPADRPKRRAQFSFLL